jgi:hypothetical protein
MFFDNIFGTSDNNNSNNDDDREGKVCSVTGLIPCKCNDAGENDRYSLKNISLSQGRAFLKDEKKLNRINTYLAQNTGDNKIVGMRIEGFDNGSQQPQAAVASAAASSTPETVLPKGTKETTPLDKLDDAFDSKMTAYSSALSEFNKELLKNENYFVVQVKTLTPINSCFNCDASLSGTDCAAMGVSNSNGDIRTALSDSTTATLRPCVIAGVTVPGWSANPTDSASCVAPLGQKCCPPPSMVNGTPMCVADFNNYDENAINSWMASCITPASPEDVNQQIALANEYCQGNGISLNYWSQNVNNFVLVTTQDPANNMTKQKFTDSNDSCSGWANSGECEKNPNYMLSSCAASCNRVGANVPGANIRPFAKMNSIPVWIVDTFPNLQDANKAKSALVFSPTVEKTLISTREDMLNAGTALIKAVSSQHSTTLADRKAMEQKINVIKAKISKLDSHKQTLDKSADVNSISSVATIKESFMSSSSSALPESLLGQEEDTRIQFKSSYAYYTVWFVIAILLIVIMFSNIFMGGGKEVGEGGEGGEGEEGEEGSSSMSSITLIMGTLMMVVFIYFLIQYILAYFKISRPDLPFGEINPLM